MVKVFITIDTEVWPESPGWPHTPLSPDENHAKELAWYFYGGEGTDGHGLPYQLNRLASGGLKATYFVDPLFSFALGTRPLCDLVKLIKQHGQDIGLHLHPEWLTDPRCQGLPEFAGPMLHGYSESAQAHLVRAGIERLHDAGADRICAFRAGGWAASLATLRALEQNGIVYDSSLNAAFSASFPDMDESVRNAFTQPVRLGGIWEFPVTSFIDRPPAGRRPLHVCAASLSEFRTVLEHAFENDWFAVVIVLHSFEFVRVNRIASGSEAASQRLLVDRFERLCTYLSENADRFETSTFSGLREDALPETEQPLVATSSRTRTVMRQIQQLASVFY